jgi:hypothetical protein
MLTLKKNNKELNDFLNFLQRISEKKKGEDIDTTFKNLKIYFIGKNELLKKYAVAPYYTRIKEDAKNGTKIFYLLALGNYHVAAASVLATLLSENRIALIDDKYMGEIVMGGKKLKTAIIRMTSVFKIGQTKPNIL